MTKDSRVFDEAELRLGRPLTDGEADAMILAKLKTIGGAKKRAKAMRKASYHPTQFDDS